METFISILIKIGIVWCGVGVFVLLYIIYSAIDYKIHQYKQNSKGKVKFREQIVEIGKKLGIRIEFDRNDNIILDNLNYRIEYKCGSLRQLELVALVLVSVSDRYVEEDE